MADEIAELVVKITGDASGLESTINGVSSELSKLEKAQGGGNSATASGTKGLAAYGQQLQNTGKSIKDFGEGLDTVTKPLQYTSVALATGGVAAAKFAIDFEDSFASVKKTVDGTPEQLDAIKQSIIDMSTVGINGHSAIPMTTAELNELAAAGGQLGIQTENIADFTEVMAQMGTATNLVGEEGAATLARFMNVMGISQGEIRNVGSAIVDLGNNSATTESEIAAMALRMGKYGSTIGMSAADVLGYSAALSSLGIEAQMGGSAIGRTWLSIESAVASGGDALNAFAKYSGKSAKEFKEQWNTDSKGAFNGLLKGLQSADNLTLALDKLGINNTQDIQAMMALVNGYDLVTASVERANIAYAENTALQAEFDAKAETTASQLAIVKNNFVEAARSIGETMLPTIKDASAGLVDWAQKLASMDDSQKKTLVNTAAGVVALGAASKGIVGITKGVGGLLEGIGSIKKAMGAGGALAKMAPTLTGIASAAGPAAIGLAATAVATVGMYEATKAYEEYRADWSRGGEEMAASLRSHVEAARELNDLQYELKSLQQVVNNPETDETTLNSSKARIEEIKQLLSEKYNLDITVNDSELDEAIEKAKNLQLLETKQQIPDLLDYADNKKDDYNQALKDQKLYQSNIEGIKQQQEATKNFRSELLLLDDAYKKGNISQEEYTDTFNKLVDATGNPNFKNMPLDVLLNSDEIDNWSKSLEKNLTNNNQLLSESESKTAEFTQAMQDLANAGLLELEFGDAEQGLSHIATAVKSADLSMMDWAATAALVQTGQKSLTDVWEQGGDVLDNYVSNYISDIQQFGASAEETAMGAALIKSGFSDIASAAATDGGLNAVVNSFKELSGQTDITGEQLTQLARKIGILPENKKINISAEGDVTIVDSVEQQVKNLDGKTFAVTVNTEGDTSGVDEVDEKVKKLDGKKCSVTFTADGTPAIATIDGVEYKITNYDASTGTATLLAKNGDAIAVIDLTTGKITAIPEEHDTEITATDNTGDGVQSAKNQLSTLPDSKEINITTVFTTKFQTSGDSNYNKFNTGNQFGGLGLAKGTTDAPGGLAIVNDEKGIADPTELIKHGNAYYMLEGRDVPVVLDKHDKVYTAAQTKAIMSGLGIPHYAEGKNNSDAFTAAKDDYSHYTKTHAVTTAEQLEKWLEFQEQYKENEKDIWDIEEQIFSLQQKLYSERVKESENWLAHEEKYNGMGVDDYLAGIDRMKAYTEEYYAQGIISHKEYTDAMLDLDEKYIDKRKEQLEELYDLSKAYISEHTYFNDWSENGDDPLAAYNRVMDRHREALANGDLTQEEYDKKMSELGSTMLSERTEQSKNWLDEQRKYFGLSDEAYAEGLNRIKAYTQQYYDWGLISRREYNEAMTELNHSLWDEAADAYDNMLGKQSDYISDMQKQFSDAEQALRDSWDVEDRAIDMADVQNQLDVYKGAVTDRGQQKYKDLQEQMKQLQRDEELYQLQVANNAVIEELQAEYEQLEADKSTFLSAIATNTDIDVSGIVGELTSGIEQSSNTITRTLSEIIDAIHGIKMEQQNFTDSRSITNYISQLSPEQQQEIINSVTGR